VQATFDPVLSGIYGCRLLTESIMEESILRSVRRSLLGSPGNRATGKDSRHTLHSGTIGYHLSVPRSCRICAQAQMWRCEIVEAQAPHLGAPICRDGSYGRSRLGRALAIALAERGGRCSPDSEGQKDGPFKILRRLRIPTM